jgi:hypothetical protein
VAVSGVLTSFTVNEAEMKRLLSDPLGPVGRDIQRRALRVTSEMRANASGVGGGPQVRTGTLLSAVGFLDFGETADGLVANVGVQTGRTIKRDWNYANLLEGPSSTSEDGVVLRGQDTDFGRAARRPFMARSLIAARD